MRQALEAWGRQPPALPLLVEKPGRTKAEEPRRWHGPSGRRRVEVESSGGRVPQEEGRFVVVPSRQLAQQHAQTYAGAQAKEAEAMADHVRQGQAQWCACGPDAETAIAASKRRGPGRRGHQPRPWRYHTHRYGLGAASRRPRRTRRGRPAKTDPPPPESGYRLVVEVDALPHTEEDNGWTVLGLLVSSVIQRQVRLSLRTHGQQLPGTKGRTTGEHGEAGDHAAWSSSSPDHGGPDLWRTGPTP